MLRRRILDAVGGSLGLLSLSGCAGLLPTVNDDNPEYPGGTLVIGNTGTEPLEVSVSVVEEQFSASLDTTVSDGETVVERGFVTASADVVATLAVRVGDDGDPATFEFLPAGGEGDAPPEVAHLSVESDVEESATWTATEGASE